MAHSPLLPTPAAALPVRLLLAFGVGLLAAPFALAAPPTDEASALAHLRLNATFPAADSVLAEPPDEVRLWFSDPPQTRGTAVRLADAAGELVPTTDALIDEEDPSQVFVRPEGPLSPGSYTVHWRVISADGHALNGTFGFELRSR